MGFKLASTGGKGVLVAGDDYFDVHAASAGELPSGSHVVVRTNKSTDLAFLSTG